MANKDTGTMERSSTEKVAALLAPRNVVLVGASDRPGSWTTRVWRNLHRYNYGKPVYPLNPGRDEIWDAKCYKSMADLPEAPDHMVVLVPAKSVAGVLRDRGLAVGTAPVAEDGAIVAEDGGSTTFLEVRVPGRSGRINGGAAPTTPTSSSKAAIVPATCVPWLWPSSTVSLT